MTYDQRYFINDDHYLPGGPMFFYTGNEADVTLYVNATGLIWENAPQFNALVVFAEHRYYGNSQPFCRSCTSVADLRFLSSEQALMDYATLVHHLKVEYDFQPSDAVIAFGGSYGGMLASWARFRYPHVWDGAIAASAPILPFEGLESFFRPNFFAEGVTYDVTPRAGSSPQCETNLRHALAAKALVQADPQLIRSSFAVCADDPTADEDMGWMATQWLNSALAYMAMGNFPYPSSYILNGDGQLPAFPIRVACESLSTDWTGDEQRWLRSLSEFGGVYYNYSQTLECNRLSGPVNNESSTVEMLWNYQYCSEIFMVGGQGPDINDMFWDDPWDGNAAAERCHQQYGIYPNRQKFFLTYGTPDDWARDATNIVWSQGEYDPWRGGGCTESLSDSLVSIVIDEAAHHLDLFFSHENDTAAIIATRNLELQHIGRWVQEKKQSVFSRRVDNAVILTSAQ